MAQDKLYEYTGIYTGKELVKKGTSIDKKTNEEKEWKLFKLMMSSGLENELYGTKFTVFLPCKGSELLEEGEPIKLVFKKGSYHNTKYNKTYETRTVVLIKEGKKEDVTIYKSEDNTPDTITTKLQTVELPPAKKLGIIEDLKKGEITLNDVISVDGQSVKVSDVIENAEQYITKSE